VEDMPGASQMHKSASGRADAVLRTAAPAVATCNLVLRAASAAFLDVSAQSPIVGRAAAATTAAAATAAASLSRDAGDDASEVVVAAMEPLATTSSGRTRSTRGLQHYDDQNQIDGSWEDRAMVAHADCAPRLLSVCLIGKPRHVLSVSGLCFFSLTGIGFVLHVFLHCRHACSEARAVPIGDPK